MRLTVRIRNILYDKRDRYSPSCLISPYNDYTGDIVPRFPWLSSDQFVMTTGDSDAPYRILEKDAILCGWTAPSEPSNREPSYVCIPGKNGKQYTVALADNGSLSCNCTGYGYRRTCSHVKEVEAA
jgi:hypothetical protein